MPPRASLRLIGHTAARPAIPRRPRALRSRTGYATLAPARPSTPARRLAIHPSFFLVHLGGISLASCLIPVIGARRRSTSSQAAQDRDDSTTGDDAAATDPPAADPPFPFIYPVQQPFPPLHQRRRLACQLRHQIETAPLDAAFNLRQLRLVTEEPQIHLPAPDAPPDPYTELSNLRPVPWVWRFPATLALHSILRLVRGELAMTATPTDPDRAKEALLPLAITIAQHSLRFDALMWNATLRGQQHQGALEWDRLVADERRRTSSDHRPEAREKIRVVTRLSKRPREVMADPKLEVWEARHRELAELAWSGQAGRKQRRSPRRPLSAKEEDTGQGLQLSSSIQPALSIPTRSLDALFLHLVEVEARPPGFVGPTSTHESHATDAAAALELAASLSRLRRKRSRRAIYRSFQLAVVADRLDLAADFWVDLLDQVRSSGGNAPPDHAGLRWLDKLLGRLVRRLRTEERSFAAAPTKPVMAAVATLARALDQLWSSEPRTAFGPVAGALIRTLATFPPAPFAGDFEPGSGLRRRARTHRKVYEMVQEVMRRVLEDLTRRDIHLGPVKSRLGLARPDKAVPPLMAGLAASDFNTLVSYALLKLQSPELAMLILERMTERGLRPTAATQNIVFSALGGGTDLDTLERLLHTRKDDPRAVPVFLKHLAETASFDHLDAIVFRLLPELHHDVDEVDPFRSTVLPPVRPPDPTGRTPFLYTTLLYALSCAGRIGLAERVFRNARWAAELSRSSSSVSGAVASQHGSATSGWVLPPHAFTIMLQMYAGEVRRGRQLERRDARSRSAAAAAAAAVNEMSPDDVTPPSTPFVRGWGRHALRVFLLQERRSRLQTELGDAHVPRTVSGLSSVEGSPVSRDPRANDSAPVRSHRRLLELPPFLRSEAAPIAAMWELEGGSKEPELKSLERALKSPQAADALRILFRIEVGERSAQEKLLDLRKRSWRNGYRAGQDSAKERVRRRSEALRRHALVRELATESG